jgi:hypothetical protein
VTWAIDTTVGTPSQFVLSGAKGSQTLALALASSTLAAGADYRVHITARTSETECSTYGNTATLTTGNANNPTSAAKESCQRGVALFCVAVSKVTPKRLVVGHKTKLTIHLTKHGKAVKGVRARIKGPKMHVRTKPSNRKGVIKRLVKMKKKGIVIVSPIASKRCNTKRVRVTKSSPQRKGVKAAAEGLRDNSTPPPQPRRPGRALVSSDVIGGRWGRHGPDGESDPGAPRRAQCRWLRIDPPPCLGARRPTRWRVWVECGPKRRSASVGSASALR